MHFIISAVGISLRRGRGHLIYHPVQSIFLSPNVMGKLGKQVIIHGSVQSQKVGRYLLVTQEALKSLIP